MVRCVGQRVEKEPDAAHNIGEAIVQPFIHRGVERMARTEQHGIDVGVFFQMMLVEGELPVRGFRLSQTLDRVQALGAEVGQHVLDPPETICTCFHTQPQLTGSGDEEGFDIAGHEPPLLDLKVPPLEAAEVDMRACQRDAGGLFVLRELVRVHAVDLIDVLIQAPRVVRGFAQHLGQVYVIQRQDLTDDVEDATFERLIHLLKILQESVKDATLDDWLALFGFRRHEVEGVTVALLANAMDASEALFEARWIPRHVVVDHQVAELQVDTLTGGLGCDADLGLGAEQFLRTLAFVRVHSAVDLARGVSPLPKMVF